MSDYSQDAELKAASLLVESNDPVVAVLGAVRRRFKLGQLKPVEVLCRTSKRVRSCFRSRSARHAQIGGRSIRTPSAF
jgi:hypothetical protein